MSSLFKSVPTPDDICLTLIDNKDKFSVEDRRKYLTEIGEKKGGVKLLDEVKLKMLTIYAEEPASSANSHKYWVICEDVSSVLNKAGLKQANAKLAKLEAETKARVKP